MKKNIILYGLLSLLLIGQSKAYIFQQPPQKDIKELEILMKNAKEKMRRNFETRQEIIKKELKALNEEKFASHIKKGRLEGIMFRLSKTPLRPEKIVNLEQKRWEAKKDWLKKANRLKHIPEINKIIKGLKIKKKIVKLADELTGIILALDRIIEKRRRKELLNEWYQKNLRIKKLKKQIDKMGVLLYMWDITQPWGNL